MNQQCKVCGEPAAGFHFGAFTCEGCKSFFGRTYNNLSSISECKNNGECIINKKNRTACKACRLRKCLLVGMSKSGSRYGRRSNWFKIHCLLQEQQNQYQQNSHQQNYDIQHHLHQQHHQLQQQQQQHQQQMNQMSQNYQNNNNNNNNISHTNKTGGVLPLSPGPITNQFIPGIYLNGNTCQLKSDSRISSPSDSGASSADPDDNASSNKDSILDSPTEKKTFNKLTKKLDTIRSLSEPIKTFTPLNCNGQKPFLTLPNVGIVPTLITNSFQTTINVQDEPIDLSVNSRKRCRTTSPISNNNNIDIPKPTPLDLTLVRSNTLSG